MRGLLTGFCFYIYHTVLGLFLSEAMRLASSDLIRGKSVQCNSSEMRVSLEFQEPFNGVIYANKFYQTKECRWDGTGSRNIAVGIPLNSNPNTQPFCGVLLKDDSGEFTATLLISPMKGLLVDGMEGLTVRCLYSVNDVTLTLPSGVNGPGIYISPQTQAGVVTGSGGSPFLQMTIRDGHGISGDPIQSAQVGQRITLDTVMRDTTIYDFWVHDCYAHDGTNTPEASISIIDATGCAVRLTRAVDVPVFSESPTSNGPKHVYVHMYGFQFTTSQLVYFECQVRPCLQSCQRPQCASATGNSTRARRQIADASLQPTDNYNLTAVIRMEPQAQQATIPVSASDGLSGSHFGGTEFCVNVSVVVAVLVTLTLLCIGSLLTGLWLCHRTRRDQIDDQGSYYNSSDSTSAPPSLRPLATTSPRSFSSTSSSKRLGL